MIRALRRAGLAGPIEYAFQIVHGVRHPHLLRSGATATEQRMPLPGDEVVPDAVLIRTRAQTVAAPPDVVWRWLAWLGAGRGGWPGWYPFAHPHDPSPIELAPDAVEARPGDLLLEVEGPESQARWRVLDAAPREHLLLHSCRTLDTGDEVARETGARWADLSWSFVLRPNADGTTRLLTRTRTRVSPRWYAWLMRPLLMGDTVMQRELLAAIGRRAERDAERGDAGARD